MARPLVLVQLSDLHLGGTWGRADPGAGLRAAVQSVRALDPAPDAVLVSGDLADHAADAEYEQVRELLAPLDAPVYILAGNHDQRDALHRHFGVPGAGGAPVQYAVDVGALRLVVLDSTRPGEDRGELDVERLDWLDRELGAAPDQPTLLAMHHPPLATGLPAFDGIGLPVDDRRALGRVLERHQQVRRLVGGHVHRTIVAELAGRAVIAAPSTYVQAELDFGSDELRFTTEPPGFAVHVLLGDDVISHVEVVV